MTRVLRRRHGFAGQHFIVVPAPELQRAATHPLLSGLRVTDAGYFPTARGHWVARRSGAQTTLVILCLDGCGTVQLGAESHAIQPGDFAWLPADESHSYGAAAGNPWTIAWAHFSGSEGDAWRELIFGAAGPRRPIVTVPRDRLHEVALDRVYAALEEGYSLRHQVGAAVALKHALATIAALVVAPGEARSAEERVRASIADLRVQWRRPFTLDELATGAGVSVTHYCTLFRRLTGYAPIDFLIRLRIRHACSLLDTTQLSVSEIAERVGYADPFYFARQFRRVMGSPPRLYRNIPKG